MGAVVGATEPEPPRAAARADARLDLPVPASAPRAAAPATLGPAFSARTGVGARHRVALDRGGRRSRAAAAEALRGRGLGRRLPRRSTPASAAVMPRYASPRARTDSTADGATRSHDPDWTALDGADPAPLVADRRRRSIAGLSGRHALRRRRGRRTRGRPPSVAGSKPERRASAEDGLTTWSSGRHALRRSPRRPASRSSSCSAQPGPRPAGARRRARLHRPALSPPAARGSAWRRSRALRARALALAAGGAGRRPPEAADLPAAAAGSCRRRRRRRARRARRADRRLRSPATTKLMTAYLALRELRPRRDVVTAPPYTALAAESLLGLEAGERITVRDLLYGLLLASRQRRRRDARASPSAGSEDAFVARDERGRRASSASTRPSYANPIGLDDAGNFSSAADLVDAGDRAARGRRSSARSSTPSATRSRAARAARTIVNRNTLVLDDAVRRRRQDRLHARRRLRPRRLRRAQRASSWSPSCSARRARPSATPRPLELLDYGFSLYASAAPVERASGSAEAAIADRDGRRCRWSRDGRSTVVARERPGRRGRASTRRRGRGPDRARASGSARRRSRSTASGRRRRRWSPRGRRRPPTLVDRRRRRPCPGSPSPAAWSLIVGAASACSRCVRRGRRRA